MVERTAWVSNEVKVQVVVDEHVWLSVYVYQKLVATKQMVRPRPVVEDAQVADWEIAAVRSTYRGAVTRDRLCSELTDESALRPCLQELMELDAVGTPAVYVAGMLVVREHESNAAILRRSPRFFPSDPGSNVHLCLVG